MISNFTRTRTRNNLTYKSVADFFFVLMFYIPVNKFSVMSGRVFLG